MKTDFTAISDWTMLVPSSFLQMAFLYFMIVVPEEIKKKIDERYAIAPFNSITKFLRDNQDVDDFLQKMIDSEPWFENKRRAFSCVARNILEPARCANCGKTIPLEKVLEGKKYCSHKCSGSSPDRLEKVKRTSIERYGCANAMQSKSVQEKLKQTNRERYGVDNVFQLEEKKEKIRQTNLERYGARNYVQSNDWKRKTVATNIEKLGVPFPSQNALVVEKRIQTNMERYGGVAPACSIDVVQKMKQTNLERYGSEYSFDNEEINAKRERTWNERYGGNPLANPDILEQRKRTNVEKYGSESYMTSPVYLAPLYEKWKQRFAGKVEPLFTADEFHGVNCGEEYAWRCCKCGTEFRTHIHTTDIDLDERMLPRCPVCHPIVGGVSNGEHELFEFIKSVYNGELVVRDRRAIRPQELDIYIPDKKVAIEFDGLYWHSEEQGKDASYHLGKTRACEENGIRLVHVFEDEWRFQRPIVEDRLKSILGVGQKSIFARKCIVKAIGAKESNEFLEHNHIQGADGAPIRYGLFYNGELVAVMTFGKPRFSRGYDYELIRFASKLGTHVVGGASKLLACFSRLNSGSIVSYADRRYSDGNLYRKLGFRLKNISQPNYWYVKNCDKLSRYACQKHKLPALLGDGFNPEWSESENMAQNGWNRIYDCGNFVFVKD